MSNKKLQQTLLKYIKNSGAVYESTLVDKFATGESMAAGIEVRKELVYLEYKRKINSIDGVITWAKRVLNA